MLTASSNSFPRMSLDKANYDEINWLAYLKKVCHLKLGKLSRALKDGRHPEKLLMRTVRSKKEEIKRKLCLLFCCKINFWPSEKQGAKI